MKDLNQSEIAATYWHGRKVTYDFFCYYKTFILRIFTIIAIIFYLTNKFIYSFKLPWNKEIKICLGFVFFALISTILSDYQEFAWLGFPDRFEGFLSFMSYLTLMYIIFDLAQSPKSQKIFFIILITITLIMSIIGVFQYFYMDLFQSEFGRWLILPSKFSKFANQLSFHQSNPVYMTLYQSNITGSFLAMIYPMSLISYFNCHQNWKKFFFALNILVFTVWIACDSRAGLFGGSAAICIYISLNLKKLKLFFQDNKLSLILLSVSYVIVVLILLQKPTSTIFNRYKKYINESNQQSTMIEEDYVLSQLDVTKDSVTLNSNFHALKMKKEGEHFNFYSINNTPLQVYSISKNALAFKEIAYKDLVITFFQTKNNEFILQYNFRKKPFVAFTYNNHFLFYDLVRKKTYEPTEVPYFLTKSFDHFASNRGYIWTRTIPLLEDTIFWGKGFDTFPVYFPRHDYVDKSKVWKGTYILVEKPHSFYLETILNVGFIGFIFLMYFFYLRFKTIKESINSPDIDSTSKIYLKIILIGAIGFLSSLFFNDSIVSVSTIFWIFIGLSMALTKEKAAN